MDELKKAPGAIEEEKKKDKRSKTVRFIGYFSTGALIAIFGVFALIAAASSWDLAYNYLKEVLANPIESWKAFLCVFVLLPAIVSFTIYVKRKDIKETFCTFKVPSLEKLMGWGFALVLIGYIGYFLGDQILAYASKLYHEPKEHLWFIGTAFVLIVFVMAAMPYLRRRFLFFFSVHYKPSKKATLALGMILFLGVGFAYWNSMTARRKINPDDRLTPTLTQMVEATKKYVFPLKADEIWQQGNNELVGAAFNGLHPSNWESLSQESFLANWQVFVEAINGPKNEQEDWQLQRNTQMNEVWLALYPSNWEGVSLASFYKVLKNYKVSYENPPRHVKDEPNKFLRDTFASLRRLLLGMMISSALALFFGLFMGTLGVFRGFFLPFIVFLSIIPPIAMMPAILVLFGVEELAKVVIIVLGTFLLMARDLKQRTVELPDEQTVKAMTLGANSFQIIRKIFLPQLMPKFVETFIIYLSPGWIFLIVSEMIASEEGLGFQIFLARRNLNMALIIPLVMWIATLAISMTGSGKLYNLIRYPWYGKEENRAWVEKLKKPFRPTMKYFSRNRDNFLNWLPGRLEFLGRLIYRGISAVAKTFYRIPTLLLEVIVFTFYGSHLLQVEGTLARWFIVLVCYVIIHDALAEAIRVEAPEYKGRRYSFLLHVAWIVIAWPFNGLRKVDHHMEKRTIDAKLATMKTTHFVPGKHMIYLEDVSVVYGEKKVLADIDLAISAGELVTLVGPSGCGKSTLLRLLLGQEQPTSGTILVNGQPIDHPDSRRGIVYQQYGTFPHLTVIENVMLGLQFKAGFFGRFMHRAEIRKQAEEMLADVLMSDHLDKYPSQLSGGQRQRVAIATTLVMRPEVIFMDEPHSGLDHFTRSALQEMIKNLCQKYGVTIIFITHSFEEAVYLGSRVIGLSQYFKDGESIKVHGARIVVDLNLGRTPKTIEQKATAEFGETQLLLARECFTEGVSHWVTELPLKHSDSFITLADGVQRVLKAPEVTS